MKSTRQSKARFVVQEHHASHLHYDVRLEMNGVLASWAVPKGVPRQPGIKRLAIKVEDHDVGYIDFEGEIAEGNYGAGTVYIWDHGTYEIDEANKDRIVVALHGKKLSGRYALIKMKGKEKEWLLFKTLPKTSSKAA
jgi:DNA ligase D-like protein (predicted 3'-phosphoesterase)